VVGLLGIDNSGHKFSTDTHGFWENLPGPGCPGPRALLSSSIVIGAAWLISMIPDASLQH